MRQLLARQLTRSKLRYAAIVDERGAIVARAGKVMPPSGGQRAPGVLSAVRRTAAGPLIDFGLPFETPAGKRGARRRALMLARHVTCHRHPRGQRRRAWRNE